MDTVTITNKQVKAVSPEGQSAVMPVGEFLSAIAPPRMDSCGLILPDGIKALISRGHTVIWVHQTPPRVFQLRWITGNSPVPFGRGSTYRNVKVALPYLIVLAVFTPGEHDRLQLSGLNECFFRNDPLQSLDDELFYPALLNCSKFHRPEGNPLSWICTQYLDRNSFINEPDTNKRLRIAFRELLRCLLDTGFNYSSEHHEQSSWFTESRRVDPRLASVEAWQQASEKDPLFVLELPWLKTGLSVAQVADRIFKNLKVPVAPVATSADMARVVFNKAS